MTKKGYILKYGVVEYKELDEMKRIELFQQGNHDAIVFTKPLAYKYQREFRIYLDNPIGNKEDHISENGLAIADSLVYTFSYATIKDKS